MTRALISWSMKFRGLVVAIAAGVLVLGIALLPQTSVDTLPEFDRPIVEVQAEALGLSAEEVEQLITVPLEQDLLNGVAFLEEIESASLPGLSSVVMTFEPGTDILDARQVVAERLTQAVGVAGLPEVSKPPQMLQPLSSTSRVAMVRLTSEEQTPIEMSVLARWQIVPRLLGLEGVANVSIWGFRDRQLQVLVDPEELRAADVSLNQVVRTTGNALEVSPLSFLEASSPGTGGWIDTVNQRLHVFHEQAITTPEELGQVPLEGPEGGAFRVDGEPVTLDEVADVTEDHQPLIGDAYCTAPNDECLLLVIEKFPAANTPEVARQVDEALAVMQPGLGGLQIDTSVYRPASYISEAFSGLGRAAVVGAVLLLAVLIAFFAYWRTAVIPAVTVPLALVAAALVLNLRGATVNLVVIAGLALGLVVIIDDAVTDVAGVARTLRRRRQNGSGVPSWRTILETTLALRTPLLYATAIAVAAVVPFLFTDGLAGAFVPPMLTTYVLAVVASLVVALLVAPALTLLLLRNAPLDRHESPVLRTLRDRYERTSARAVGRVGPALVALAVLVVAGLVAVPLLDVSLRPSLQERDVLVNVEAEPGTSLPAMDTVMAEAVGTVSGLPGVRDVGAHVGRAITSDQVVNVNSGEIWVTLDPSADYDRAFAAIEETMDGFDQITHEVTTYSAQRVTDVLGRRGGGDNLVVRVYGEDPAVLEQTAEQVRASVGGVDGVVEPTLDVPPTEDTIQVEVDLAAAEANGIKPGDVRRAATVLLSGITAGNLFEEQKVFDVVVWGAPNIRENEEDVTNLLIDKPGGGQVRLGDVADVRVADTPAAIRHHSVMSYRDVVADVSGRSIADVAADVDVAVEQVAFPLEYHAEVLGDFAEARSSRTAVLTVGIAAAIVIFLLLQAAFGSWRLAVLGFVLLPVALSGGLVAALLTGGAITLGTVGGLVAVLAIAARALILLVRHAQHLQRVEELEFGPDLVVRATRDRLGTVVTAGLATIAVFLPFAVLGGVGFEIIGPMAATVIGGLVTSTVVVLLVAPALYLRLGHVRALDTTGEDLRRYERDDLERVM